MLKYVRKIKLKRSHKPPICVTKTIYLDISTLGLFQQNRKKLNTDYIMLRKNVIPKRWNYGVENKEKGGELKLTLKKVLKRKKYIGT